MDNYLKLNDNKVYILFHKPRNIIGSLISLWTLGKYSHCEFLINGKVYLADVLKGVTEVDYKEKSNVDIYELHEHIEMNDILDFFHYNKGKKYDMDGIIGSQFLWFLNSHNEDEFFCSEFCLNAIDYALQFSLTYNLKELKYKGYHKFSPVRLYKYLKDMELIKERTRVITIG